MLEETEEGKKVARLNGRKHFAVYEKRKEDSLPAVPIFSIFDNTAVSVSSTGTSRNHNLNRAIPKWHLYY
jgi:hypothetical protein